MVSSVPFFLVYIAPETSMNTASTTSLSPSLVVKTIALD